MRSRCLCSVRGRLLCCPRVATRQRRKASKRLRWPESRARWPRVVPPDLAKRCPRLYTLSLVLRLPAVFRHRTYQKVPRTVPTPHALDQNRTALGQNPSPPTVDSRTPTLVLIFSIHLISPRHSIAEFGQTGRKLRKDGCSLDVLTPARNPTRSLSPHRTAPRLARVDRVPAYPHHRQHLRHPANAYYDLLTSRIA